MLVCNLYGGPGTGKSTTAAGVFSKLKLAGVNAELVTEYAKDIVWEGSFNKLNNQVYVFGKQFQRIDRLRGQVDVIVTDSPILLSIVYNRLNPNPIENSIFDPLVKYCYDSLDNLDVFLIREKAFKQAGRVQTEIEAREIDNQIRVQILDPYCKYAKVKADQQAIDIVYNMALGRLIGRLNK